jgi:hypothetical protein
MPNQLDYLFLYILYVHGRPDGGAKAKRTICSADLGYMQRQIFTVSVKYTGVSKKTRWKFNRLSCIINFTRQFNFYVGRKNCYLDTFLNRNDEKWPLATYSSNKLIVGRNHILPPLLGIQKHRESAASYLFRKAFDYECSLFMQFLFSCLTKTKIDELSSF